MSAHELGGALIDGRHILPIRVYYEDTDFSGAVYHANYLRFFERGRTEMLRALGFSQSALHARADASIAFVVRRMTLDFLRPARMDDVIEIRTETLDVRAAAIELRQTVLRGRETLVEGSVCIACVSDGRARRLPPELRAAFAALVARQSDTILKPVGGG